MVAGVVVVLVLVAVVAWALDAGRADDEVVRNTDLAGAPIGGLGRAELAPVVDALAERWRDATVRLETPAGDLTLAAAEVGLVVDRAATVEEALDAGREGAALLQPLRWVLSAVDHHDVPVRVQVDEAAVRAVLDARDPTGRTAPVEPSIRLEDGELVAVPGVPGRGLPPEEVVGAITDAAAGGELPIVAAVEPGSVPPRLADANATALADVANARTAGPLVVQAGSGQAEIPAATQRAWLRSRPAEAGLELVTDPALVLADLEAALADVGERPVDAGFTVSGGQVSIVEGRPGTTCCAPEAPAQVLEAIIEPGPAPVRVGLRPAEPGRTVEEARALGIVEVLGTFTTNHAAGEPRVRNIHRIADIIRGAVIEPGASFSVNRFVGPRTTAKGFVSAGVIQNGVFEEGVGGGISQFATTLFNAAFFGGLDFGEYQSHSIYISRYPYGREATLSYPHPDLVIENTTPHGVLIWPTYTESSITVTLYGTASVRGEQTGQSEAPRGNCTRVTTTRTRIWDDGRRATDTVGATYRPAEGVQC